MTNILLVTSETSGTAAANLKAALESKGHTVTVSLETTTALDAAWAGGAFGLIVTCRPTYTNISSTPSAMQNWIKDKWVAGVPLLLGGWEVDPSTTNVGTRPILGMHLGLLQNTAIATASGAAYDPSQRNMRIRTAHPITTGFSGIVAVHTVSQSHALDQHASAYVGVEVGDLWDGSNRFGVRMTAAATGTALGAAPLGGENRLGLTTAPARIVFCGWLDAEEGDYTADGKTILDQAVDWVSAEYSPPQTSKIALGAALASKLYLGSTQASKAYLGSTQIFGGS